MKNNTETAIKLGRRVNGKHQSAPWEDYGEDAAPAAEKKGKKKGRGKGKDRERSEKPPPPPQAASGGGTERPRLRLKKEIDAFCHWFQFGRCKHAKDLECGKKHQLLKRHEIEFLKERYDKKGKKKGEGKGKKGDKSRARSKSVQKSKTGIGWLEVNGRKVPYCRMAY